MNMDHRIYQIALSQINGLSCRSCRQLLELGISPEEVFSMSHSGLKQIFGNHDKIVGSIESKQPLEFAKKELEFVEKYNIKVLFHTDAEYPKRLNRPECMDTPVVLFMKGDCDLNKKHVLSFVGTRRATDAGRKTTRTLIEQLGGDDTLIVSGLAYGIDSESHQAALDNQKATVGVLGHGLDQIYPPQNRNLAKAMVENGGLLTEYPSETRLNPRLFPARNRIIAALSDATIVVEAAEKGGALITAAIANSYQREVFAVPGRLTDKYAAGCNNLIADNKALIIRNAKDIFYHLGWPLENETGVQTSLFPDLTKDEQTIYRCLEQNDGITLDEITEKCDFSMPKIAAITLNLELKGIIRCLPGKKYVIC